MNRVAVFAHYDNNNLIQDYVVYYLQELKKVSQKIVFVSDGDISDNELSKLSGIVDYCIAKKHGEYDFGSYKRGYLYAKENGWLENCEELILCNDSCYGPLFDIEKYFDEMSARPVDFWGNTASPEGFKREGDKKILGIPLSHIQSYFIVFKPQVFKSDTFNNFINSIKKELDKDFIIINYEMGLTKLLEEQGFAWDVYCQLSKKYPAMHLFKYKELIKDDRSLFVKTSIYRYNNIQDIVYPSMNLIKNYTNYNINLIKNDISANRNFDVWKQHPKKFLCAWRKNFLKFNFKKRTIELFDKIYKF